MSGCSYNCSVRPQDIEPDPDITGFGVLVSYTVTAAIVVAIVVVHYFLAYRPDLDTFRCDNTTSESNEASGFRPNPVDTMILWVVRRRSAGSHYWRLSYLDAPLIKCVLAMSDLQLVTGIAILISGYTQLQCGLSCYHWKIIGRLAWFSSLTHLSCLTLLRNYLYNNPAQRQWRLFLMFILIIMLITAMVPTGNYRWLETWYSYTTANPDIALSDYAICSFSKPLQTGTVTFLALIILLLLIGIGFVTRIVKLHRSLAISLVSRVRGNLSKGARKYLWTLYTWRESSTSSMRRTGKIFYIPALSLFLTLRIILDNWSSMFFEVAWLLFSFPYALLSLIHDIKAINPKNELGDISNERWSFGQTMALILLGVPLITIIEILYPETKKDNSSSPSTSPLARDDDTYGHTTTLFSTESQTMEMADPKDFSDLNPDQDYYQHSTCMGVGTIYFIVAEIALGTFAVTFISLSNPTNVAAQAVHICVRLLLYIPVSLWGLIFVSFFIDRVVGQRRSARFKRPLLVLLQTINLVLFLGLAATLTTLVPLYW